MKFSEILDLFNQGKGTAKSHMKNLIEMAAVDGEFADIEYQLLKTIAKRNNISENQLQEIKKNPHGIEFEIPKDIKDKFHQMYDLVHMMNIDGTIHNEERKLCQIFAVKFGYNKDKVEELIEAIRGNITNNQSHDESYKRLGMLIA